MPSAVPGPLPPFIPRQECLWCKVFKRRQAESWNQEAACFLPVFEYLDFMMNHLHALCLLHLFQTSEDWCLVMMVKLAWSWLWWIIMAAAEQSSVCGPALWDRCSFNGFIWDAHHQPLYNQPHECASTSTALINVAARINSNVLTTGLRTNCLLLLLNCKGDRRTICSW